MTERIILAIISLGLGFLLPPFLEAESTGQIVYITEVEGEIKAGTFQYLKRVIKLAKAENANFLIIKLDTPGGLLKSTKDIVDLILTSPVKTVVFVHKSGGWAYSAGTFILLAADYAIVHPEASIGAAQPRELGIDEIKEVDPKIIEGMVSWIKSLAVKNQRNPEIAEKFVRENLTLTGEEAKKLGVINETARDLDEVFLKLGISEPKITEIQPTPIEKFFDLLSHPYLISLFLSLGVLGLIFAFQTGEFELAGILGLIFLLIGLWGIGIIQFSVFGVLLISLGIFLLIMEVSEPGFGIFGGLGAISLLLGIFTFEAEPFLFPKFFDAMTMVVLGATLVIAILFVILGRSAVKVLKAKPKTGPEALIGKVGEVIKTLEPFGQVKINHEIWLARSLNGKTIPKKSKVEIIKIEGNTLWVKRIK